MKTYKINIKKMVRFIKNMLALVGAVLVYCAVSTMDYHAFELGAKSPDHISSLLITGVLLLIPALAGVIFKAIKER